MTYPEGTFMWAMEQAKEGKTVTRLGWDLALTFRCGQLLDHDNHQAELDYDMIFATDWKVRS